MLDDVVFVLRKYLRIYFQRFKDTGEQMKFNDTFNKLNSIMLTIFKIRGVKNTKKYLGHETSDFEPILFFLISQTMISWESKYFLLSWLSVVLLIPFEFSRLDSDVIG